MTSRKRPLQREETSKINSLTQLRSSDDSKNRIAWMVKPETTETSAWWQDPAPSNDEWWNDEQAKRTKTENSAQHTFDGMTLGAADLSNQSGEKQKGDNDDADDDSLNPDSIAARAQHLEHERCLRDPIYDYIVNLTHEKKRQFVDKLKVHLSEKFDCDLSDASNRWTSTLNDTLATDFNYVFHTLLFYTMSCEDEFMERQIIAPTFSANEITEREAFDERYIEFCSKHLSALTNQQITGGIINMRSYVEQCIGNYVTL